MQVSSALRTSSAVALTAAFAFAPIGNLLGMEHFVPVARTAEAAAAIQTGTITGLAVAHDYSLGKNVPLANLTVQLRLDENDTVQQIATTTASGTYSFTAPKSTYRVCYVAPDAYAPDIKEPTCAIVGWSDAPQPVENFILTQKPVIVFGDGATSTEVLKGSTFTDVSNFAMKDGKVFGQGIIPSGSVDTKTLGDYTLVYTAQHEASQLMVAAKRVVHVVDQLTKSTTGTSSSAAGLQVVGATITPTASVGIPSGSGVASGAIAKSPDCKLLSTYMSPKLVNDKIEVMKLQTFLFLNENMLFVRTTGVYDASTERAVRIFQDRYFDDVMAPWGIDGNTGNVYLTTEKKINERYCGNVQPLTAAEQHEILAYKRGNMKAPVAVVAIKPIADATNTTTVADSSTTSKIASWWQGIKKNLLAAFPIFGKSENKGGAMVASGTKSADSPAATKDVVSKANETASVAVPHKPMIFDMTVFASVLAIALGIAAFAFAIYLYRRTRGEEEVQVVTATAKETPKVPVKPKN